MYSGGPCYLHSRLTSSDVFTWEMCNATPWFTEEDNLCFRQGEAATARGVGFPSLLFTEHGIFLPRSARLQSPLLYVLGQNLLAAKRPARVHTRAFSTSFSVSLFSLPGLCSCLRYTVSDSTCLYPCFHLTPPFPPSCSLSFAISPSVRGLMWDCKWSSLTSISG